MTEQIQFKENPEITAKQLSSLFQSAGMNRPIDDLPRLSMMIRNASLTIAAFVDEKLIGIARSMTDFSYCCYLSDLAVSSDYQGRGIGKELVRRTIDRIGPQCNLLLLSAPGAMTYYPSQGFEQVNNGWIIKRTK